ncbi:Major facilitator-type transporter hxnP [Colletotrichum trifolii]|uniref:Major facilitator-type transporter hxnP n=1 Tax=Colletotrichum trifolii TaxID=5466 RepID=A0A4R8RMY2_COLTR|nr:Major facilitator-type transporter hxnP [Colletotrichum trifolii]
MLRIKDKINNPSEASQAGDQEHGAQILISSATERAYDRKMDYWLLPFMSIMYFFNAVDRRNLGNTETDGMSKDLGFVGEQYSLLILLFYITLFYTRGELGFRIALFFGSALLASAFSGLISFGVFRIRDPHVHGWMLLFTIQGALTMISGVVALWWLPASPKTAWFLNPAEREVAALWSLRDGTRDVEESFSIRECFRTWNDWKFPISTVTTSLLTVPPSVAGFLVLLDITYSSDRNRERTFRTAYAPRYVATLVGTAACNITFICFTLWLGLWMRKENTRKNKEQDVSLRAEDVETREPKEGEKDPRWRFFV